MNKNLTIIIFILIIPMLTYFSLTNTEKNLLAGKALPQNSPQLIKFSSAMCSDCQKMETLIKETFPKYKNKIKFIEVNVQNQDKNTQELIKKYKITLVPTIIYLDKNGNKVLKTEGYVKKEEFVNHLERLIK